MFGDPGRLPEQPAPLSANDVSILFPLPKADDDLSAFISLADLTDANGTRLLSNPDFARYVAIAEGPAGKVDGTPARQIAFPSETRDLRPGSKPAFASTSARPGFPKTS